MSRRSTSAPARRRVRAFAAGLTGVACAVALTVVPAASAADDDGARDGSRPALPKLKGEVGPGFNISLKQGAVPSGKYKLIVKDLGTIHNFRITGAGVDKATSIPGTGKSVFKITVTPGIYNIRCDAHRETMTDLLEVF